MEYFIPRFEFYAILYHNIYDNNRQLYKILKNIFFVNTIDLKTKILFKWHYGVRLYYTSRLASLADTSARRNNQTYLKDGK